MKPEAEIRAKIVAATDAIIAACDAVVDDGDRTPLAFYVLDLFAAANNLLCDAAAAVEIGGVPSDATKRRLSAEADMIVQRTLAGVREILSRPQQTVTIVDQPRSMRTLQQRANFRADPSASDEATLARLSAALDTPLTSPAPVCGDPQISAPPQSALRTPQSGKASA